MFAIRTLKTVEPLSVVCTKSECSPLGSHRRDFLRREEEAVAEAARRAATRSQGDGAAAAAGGQDAVEDTVGKGASDDDLEQALKASLETARREGATILSDGSRPTKITKTIDLTEEDGDLQVRSLVDASAQ